MSFVARFVRHAAGPSLGLLTLLGAAACRGDASRAADSAGAPPTESALPAPAPAPAAPADSSAAPADTLNDAQIAHVAMTSNSIDSASGVLATGKGQSQAVKDFAQTMITDHSGVNRQATELATRLKLTPEDNESSRQLKASADSSTQRLGGLSGAAFDSAYIDDEVAFHQTVLDALDNTLIPGAQNAELKQLLQGARRAVAAHLDRAKGLQRSLGRP